MPDQNVIEKPIQDLLNSFHNYAQARQVFLEAINLPSSCGDPLLEFSEVLVSALLRARLADSQAKKGYDLIRENGRLVQVRYLSNPADCWRNEPNIRFSQGLDDCALVIFENLALQSVLVFPNEICEQVAKLLGKRHGNKHTSIKFTHRNYVTILENPSKFASLGVEIFRFLDVD